ncbi:MAG: SDR family oxidoreductase [Elusimicrobia bacterium]|nr:SDR family oxidoreductase [Elusimicrobiota bacterium]
MIEGQTVWITGAGSGIGLEMTREFLRKGASVLAIDRDAKALAELKKEAALLRFPLATLTADVGSGPDFLAALEGALKSNGSPAVFVNNAGIARVGAFSEIGLDVFEEVLRVNLRGVIYGTRFALAQMRTADRGIIINMASTAGLLPSAFMTSYAASKFAVVGFTRSLQSELKLSQSPVRLCLVTPGFIDTPIMNQRGVEFPKWLRWTVADAARTAKAIVKGALAGKEEITPDLGGRLLQRAYRWAPVLTAGGAKLLFAHSMAELIGKKAIKIAPPK